MKKILFSLTVPFFAFPLYCMQPPAQPTSASVATMSDIAATSSSAAPTAPSTDLASYETDYTRCKNPTEEYVELYSPNGEPLATYKNGGLERQYADLEALLSGARRDKTGTWQNTQGTAVALQNRPEPFIPYGLPRNT